MVLHGNWLTEVGGYIGKTSRGILDVGGKAINILTTRGGSDVTTDVYEGGESAPDYTMPILLGGAAVAAILLLKGKRR